MDRRTHRLDLLAISLDDNEDVRGAHHVASDSDSEVYCDSVDQFGAEEVRLSLCFRDSSSVAESEGAVTQSPVTVKKDLRLPFRTQRADTGIP